MASLRDPDSRQPTPRPDFELLRASLRIGEVVGHSLLTTLDRGCEINLLLRAMVGIFSPCTGHSQR